ncbi:hypothetical protein B0H13DRAFT_1890280 [Mycena leptocephala]|nr:hypothetical protein B0H13DRAFT_1890280 [Mycena leptocephala]
MPGMRSHARCELGAYEQHGQRMRDLYRCHRDMILVYGPGEEVRANETRWTAPAANASVRRVQTLNGIVVAFVDARKGSVEVGVAKEIDHKDMASYIDVNGNLVDVLVNGAQCCRRRRMRAGESGCSQGRGARDRIYKEREVTPGRGCESGACGVENRRVRYGNEEGRGRRVRSVRGGKGTSRQTGPNRRVACARVQRGGGVVGREGAGCNAEGGEVTAGGREVASQCAEHLDKHVWRCGWD